MANVTGDQVLGQIARQQNDWFRRVREGSLDPTQVMEIHRILQDFADGKMPDLPNLGKTHRIERECFKLTCGKSFSPTEFIGQGWTAWKGPADGNGLEGEEDRDAREDNLSVIDWDQVLLGSHLQEKETSVHGEEKLKRAIASGNIQLGGKAFRSLWEDYQANGENSVLEKLRRKGVTRIYFFGLRLRDPDGYRHVLYLYVDAFRWYWRCYPLGNRWDADDPSASLASN